MGSERQLNYPDNKTTDSLVSFREIQLFRRRWMLLILLPIALLAIAPLVFGMYKQLVLGQAWGCRPLSDNALIMHAFFAILLGGGTLGLLYVLRLETEVRDDALYLRFYPLIRRKIYFKDIRACESRTYHPIREYGGWGIRYGGKKGWAYNVSGNQGVQLELSNNKRLLIGSQRVEELAVAIKTKIKQ
jgi:hypothetical protein